VVVDEDVATALTVQPQESTSLFVAGCAERMVQMATGLWEASPGRLEDTERVLALVDDLWDLAAPAERFRVHAESLSELPDLQPPEDDEVVVTAADTYSFYAALVLRYAASYRAYHESEDALRCAHACLSAMGQLDGNTPGAAFFDEEMRRQRDVLVPEDTPGGSTQDREEDRAVGLARLTAVRGRSSS
jgi:hypothetical protein